MIREVVTRLRGLVLRSMQESVRRREASGRDFLRHIIENKLDDWTIYGNTPQMILIGPEKRPLYVRALPIKQLDQFNKGFGDLLYKHMCLFKNLRWLTSDEPVDDAALQKTATDFDIILSNTTLRFDIEALCSMVLFSCWENRRWNRRRWRRYWREAIGHDEILMVFFALWCLNYECQKKTVEFLIRKTGLLRSGTPLPPSLQRVSGLRGKSVKPLYPNSVFSSSDTPKTPMSSLPKVPA